MSDKKCTAPGNNHSLDIYTLYQGRPYPITICGYHITRDPSGAIAWEARSQEMFSDGDKTTWSFGSLPYSKVIKTKMRAATILWSLYEMEAFKYSRDPYRTVALGLLALKAGKTAQEVADGLEASPAARVGHV